VLQNSDFDLSHQKGIILVLPYKKKKRKNIVTKALVSLLLSCFIILFTNQEPPWLTFIIDTPIVIK